MRDASPTVNPGKVHSASFPVELLAYGVDRGTTRPSEDELKAILENLQLFCDGEGVLCNCVCTEKIRHVVRWSDVYNPHGSPGFCLV